ncbi:MAG: MFS transporter [Rhodospirillales bacterium]|nr:MFS transporter [Rhodospirillales bacterium]
MSEATHRYSLAQLRERARGRMARLQPQRFHVPSLDALNFLVADVRGALGPYVTVYLATDRHWDLAAVGLVMTLGGWIGLVTQTPLGWLLDATQRKRGFLAGALLVLAAGALVIALYPSFWPVLVANGMMQVVSGVFTPAVAALTVGLFQRRDLTRRMGRNGSFSRAGNLGTAMLAAVIAWKLSARDVFFVVPGMAVGGIIAALSIPHGAIDLRRARGLRSGEKEESGPQAWHALLHARPLLVYGAFSLLLEFADAPLLTLAAQKLGVTHPGMGVVMTSACIMAQQAGMLPAAILMGRLADRTGHRKLLLAGTVLIVAQGLLTAFFNDLVILIGLQVIGGVGIGLFTALTPLLLADATQGTGRYNLSQGAIATMRALGVTSSGLATEMVVKHIGYAAAFYGCAGVAALALLLLWGLMPETRPDLG